MSAVPVRPMPFRPVFRQLQLIVPGGIITYYLGIVHEFAQVLEGVAGSWGRYVPGCSISDGHSP